MTLYSVLAYNDRVCIRAVKKMPGVQAKAFICNMHTPCKEQEN